MLGDTIIPFIVVTSGVVTLVVLYLARVADRNYSEAVNHQRRDVWVLGDIFFTVSFVLGVIIIAVRLIVPETVANVAWGRMAGSIVGALGLSVSFAMHRQIVYMKTSLIRGKTHCFWFCGKLRQVSPQWEKVSTNICGLMFIAGFLFLLLDFVYSVIGG